MAAPNERQNKAARFLQHITISRDQTQKRQQLDESLALRALLSPTSASDHPGQPTQEFDNPPLDIRVTRPSSVDSALLAVLDGHRRARSHYEEALPSDRDSSSGTDDASSYAGDVGNDGTRNAGSMEKKLELWLGSKGNMDDRAPSLRSPGRQPLRGPSTKPPPRQDDFDPSPTTATSSSDTKVLIRQGPETPFFAGAPVATRSRWARYPTMNPKFSDPDESESQTGHDSDAALSPLYCPPLPGDHKNSTQSRREWSSPSKPSFRRPAPPLLSSGAENHGRLKQHVVTAGGGDGGSGSDGVHGSSRSPKASSPLELEGQITIKERIRELNMELEALKAQLPTDPNPTASGLPAKEMGHFQQRSGPRWRKIYRIKGAPYLGKPAWDHGDAGLHLQGSMPIASLDKFLENQSLLFLVYNDYRFAEPASYELNEDEWEVPPLPEPSAQSISFPGRPMVQALVSLSELYPNFGTAFPNLDFSEEMATPYLSLFYMFPEWKSKSRELSRDDRDCVEALFTYLERKMGLVYRDVLGQLSSGRISFSALQYLIKPGDIVVRPKPCPTAFMSNGWLAYTKPSKSKRNHLVSRATTTIDKDSLKPFWEPQSPVAMGETGTPKLKQRKAPASDRESEDTHQVWTVSGWNWEITHGQLSRHQEVLELRINPSATELFDVTSLEWYPLQYAPEEIKSLLRKRGHTYWQCRERRFVGYSDQGHEPDEFENVGFSPPPSRKYPRCLSHTLL